MIQLSLYSTTLALYSGSTNTLRYLNVIDFRPRELHAACALLWSSQRSIQFAECPWFSVTLVSAE